MNSPRTSLDSRSLVRLGVAVVFVAMAAGAATFNSNIPNGATRSWSDPTIWNLVSGSDVDGIPDSDDTANLYPAAWPYGCTLNLDAGWSCGTMNVIANGGNNCTLNVPVNGTIGVLNWTDSANYLSWQLLTGYGQIQMSEFHDNGSYKGRLLSYSGGHTSVIAFTGDSVIEYNTRSAATYTMKMDFSAADSVNLYRSPASGALTSETLSTYLGNNTNLIVIGRSDNGTQNWTVGAGSHPALMPGGSSQDAGITKVGSGDVNMADVDIVFDLGVAHGADDGDALSANGLLGGGLYGGTVYANSLNVLPAASGSIPRRLDILGRLVLDGQGGLQAGGAGNGKGVNAVTVGTTALEVRLNTGSSSLYAGQLVATSTASEFYFGSTGAGKVKVNVNNESRDRHDDRDKPVIVANTLHLGPNAYLSDRNWWQDVDGNAHGTIEFKALVTEGTARTDWRSDHTTLHAVGGAGYNGFEAQSLDNGLAGPGASNYLIDKLVIGRRADGTDAGSDLWLRDAYDNYSGDLTREAVYVNSLEMYAGSQLMLKRISLYYYSGGTWVQAVPGPFTLNGSSGTIWIPEPASVVVLGLCGLVALRRRRGGQAGRLLEVRRV